MEQQKKDKKGIILGGCGGCLTLLCLASAAFWGYLVVQDSGGINAEEATPGVLGSCCCALLSLGLVVVGVVMAMKAKKA